MRKIKAIIETEFTNCNYEEEFEVPDDISDKEISEMVECWADSYIFVNWWEENENLD